MQTRNRLEIEISKAELLRDVTTFSTMDCFFICRHNERSHVSKTAKDQGKNPRWDEKFEIYPKIDTENVEFDVKHEGISSNEMVGTCTVKVH